MAVLPVASDITGAATNEGQAKTWFSVLRQYIAQQIGANGTQIESLQTLGTPFNGSVSKTGAYTVAATDRGKVIRCTGTWTLSVTAVATLQDGFVFAVLNEGSGTITVDPNLTEQVDGATTKALTAGSFTVFYCDGAKLKSMGSIDSAAVIAALGFTPAPSTGGNYVGKDMGHNNVGSLVIAAQEASGYGAGAAVAGSYLTVSGIVNGGGYLSGGATLTGTWRCLYAGNISTAGLWQRIS